MAQLTLCKRADLVVQSTLCINSLRRHSGDLTEDLLPEPVSSDVTRGLSEKEGAVAADDLVGPISTRGTAPHAPAERPDGLLRQHQTLAPMARHRPAPCEAIVVELRTHSIKV